MEFSCVVILIICINTTFHLPCIIVNSNKSTELATSGIVRCFPESRIRMGGGGPWVDNPDNPGHSWGIRIRVALLMYCLYIRLGPCLPRIDLTRAALMILPGPP